MDKCSKCGYPPWQCQCGTATTSLGPKLRLFTAVMARSAPFAATSKVRLACGVIRRRKHVAVQS